jgi:hypothetical protein
VPNDAVMVPRELLVQIQKVLRDAAIVLERELYYSLADRVNDAAVTAKSLLERGAK